MSNKLGIILFIEVTMPQSNDTIKILEKQREILDANLTDFRDDNLVHSIYRFNTAMLQEKYHE